MQHGMQAGYGGVYRSQQPHEQQPLQQSYMVSGPGYTGQNMAQQPYPQQAAAAPPP